MSSSAPLPPHLAWWPVLAEALLSFYTPDTEGLAVDNAVGRVLAESAFARTPLPRFAESLRDGFLFYRADFDTARTAGLPITCEVAAGCLDTPLLESGTAQRIFTGAPVRAGEDAVVVPFEACHFDGKRVYPQRLNRSSFIRREGSDAAAGENLFSAGHRLTAVDAALLASCGVEVVSVNQSLQVALCCSGSELAAEATGQVGKKRSVNHLLLQEGLRRTGAALDSLTLVADEREPLEKFYRCGASLLISSGGMGPGKYDLGRQLFTELGGEAVLTTLSMQPGKSLLCGRLNRSIVLGLPGPPRAVATLVEELVVPICRLLEGEDPALCRPQIIQLPLAAGSLRRGGQLPGLKGGVLVFDNGRCAVRLTEKRERPDCHLLVPPGSELTAGQPVEVHLLRR